MSPTPCSAGCAFDDQSPGQGHGSCHLNFKRQCKTSITALPHVQQDVLLMTSLQVKDMEAVT